MSCQKNCKCCNIEVTQERFLYLAEQGKLKSCQTYKITDIQNGLFVTTITNSTFSPKASLSFLAPDYTLHEQYHYTDGAIANGVTVIWGGYYWTNTSGGASTPNLPSERILDDTGDFTEVAKSVANGYQEIMLDVTIQQSNNNLYIVSAKDDKSNYIEQSLAIQSLLGWLPLEVNQWNNISIYENKVLVCNNVVYFNSPMDLSLITGNTGNFIYSQEAPFFISRISQNKVTGQFSAIKGNVTHTCSIIYRNTLSGLLNSIDSNYLTSKAEIQGNTISGGFYSNGYPTIYAMCLDDKAKCNNNVLSGDGTAIRNCHGHEETEISGNTLSGNGAKITNIIQKFLDECNDNTLSGQDTRIEVCNQDYNTKINGHTLAQTGEYIKQLKLTESEITNGTIAIHRLDASNIDINLTGFTQPIYDEDISANVGAFAIEHDFTASPLNSGSSVYYNIIPNGARITNITTVGNATGGAGAELAFGLESDAPNLLAAAVLATVNAGQFYNNISTPATANRSLQIAASVANVTGGSVTVKVEFVL